MDLLVSLSGPFGLLLPGFACVVGSTLALGELAFRRAGRAERWCGGAVLSLSLATATLQLLLYAGWMYRGVVLALLLLATAALVLCERLTRPPGLARSKWKLEPTPGHVLGYTLAAVGLGIALLAVYYLPIWPWDSLGYHLSFVNFVLQGGGFAELPPDVPYLSTYPRNVELLFAALRLLLPDDRLVDLGQLPLGLVGALALASIARRFGAARADALLAGCVWLLLPGVYLQLPTNYIDVGGAAFFLLASYFLSLPPTARRLIMAGLATGLFLGTKPSVPPAAALLAVMLVVRGVRHGLTKPALGAVLAAGALGLEGYVQQLVRHGNPVWPAIVKLGPLELPGTITVKELLSSGAGAQKVHGPLLVRIWKSWTSLDALPLFDMRVGGLGPLFWAALVTSLWFVVRRLRSGAPAESRAAAWCWLALAGISVVTPDPAVVRYVLALPALCLALGAAAFTGLAPARRRAGAYVVALGMGWSLTYASPGLAGEGPPLWEYASMSWEERAVAVGANGPPREFVRALNELRPGEIAVYDKALWLPYLMWRSDSANRAVRIPDGSTVAEVRALLARPGVRLLAAGDDQPAAQAVAAEPDLYEHLFDCPEPCKVYRRR